MAAEACEEYIDFLCTQPEVPEFVSGFVSQFSQEESDDLVRKWPQRDKCLNQTEEMQIGRAIFREMSNELDSLADNADERKTIAKQRRIS
jgi:hypothetical protein